MAEERQEREGELNGDTGDVVAGCITIKQGGARSVRAREVSIRHGGAVRLQADSVEVTQGGIVLARADRMNLTGGAAGVLLTRSAKVTDSAVGVVIAQHVEGENVRVLFGWREALAFGAAAGAAFWLLTRFGRGRR